MADGITTEGVIGFYDTHPINEYEIFQKLWAKEVDVNELTQYDLKELDQDNYYGPEGVEILAQRAGIAYGHHVLDVCSGMGGPARWLACKIGCLVTGIDLTQSRVDAAQRFTQLVGLSGVVDFVQGDATAMTFEDDTYDAAISQEAWLHIMDKEKLIGEVTRVVKPDGTIAFTDIIRRQLLASEEQARLLNELHAPGIVPAERYLSLLQEAGCRIELHEDISEEWAQIMVDRLAMFRSLRDTTVEKFGEAHFNQWDDLYQFYVGLFTSGKLGGARITARRVPNG